MTASTTTTPEPIILRRDLAKMLGDVSGETMRRWLRSGKLPPPDVELSARTMGWRRSTLAAAGISV